MGRENYSPLNDIPAIEWTKYKFAEKSYKKQDNKLFQIATKGHSLELQHMFNTVITCPTLNEYDRRLTENIRERYDITGDLSFSDLQIVDGLYSSIVAEQYSTIMDNVSLDNSLENEISFETGIEGK